MGGSVLEEKYLDSFYFLMYFILCSNAGSDVRDTHSFC